MTFYCTKLCLLYSSLHSWPEKKKKEAILGLGLNVAFWLVELKLIVFCADPGGPLSWVDSRTGKAEKEDVCSEAKGETRGASTSGGDIVRDLHEGPEILV